MCVCVCVCGGGGGGGGGERIKKGWRGLSLLHSRITRQHGWSANHINQQAVQILMYSSLTRNERNGEFYCCCITGPYSRPFIPYYHLNLQDPRINGTHVITIGGGPKINEEELKSLVSDPSKDFFTADGSAQRVIQRMRDLAEQDCGAK